MSLLQLISDTQHTPRARAHTHIRTVSNEKLHLSVIALNNRLLFSLNKIIYVTILFKIYKL